MVRFVLDDDKVYKVVAESDDAIWVIDYDNPCAPKMVKQDGLVNLEEIPVPDDYMQESVVSRAIYDTAKKRLGILSAILSDNAYITNAALRQRAIAKIAQDARVSQKTLKRWYYSYLAYGERGLCPASKIKKSKTLPQEHEKKIASALSKYYYSPKKRSLKTTYEMMLLKYYRNEQRIIVPDHPTYGQFLYYYRKNRDVVRKLISREGIGEYQKNARPLLGKGDAGITTIGYFEIDATVADIYVVSRFDRKPIGRPVLYVAIDIASRMIAGIYVGFEESAEAVLTCLANAACDKVDFCKEHGICVAFDGKNYFSVAGGMGKVDVSKIGMAPFWFALWGMFRSKLQEFDATFKAYCETQEIDETTRQKLACKMAGTAFDATMGDEINCIAPSTTTCRALKEEQTRSAKYTPDEVWGEFQKLDISGSSSTKVPTFKKTAKFVGAFADKNRVLTDEEKSLVPQLGEDYILPKEVVTTCHLIARTRGTARPMTNVMLRGDPSVGKTAGARAIAAGLGLPYTFITCNAGTEMYNLIGDMMPVDSSASADSINEELFKDLPSATDISMDPAAAYEAITGSEKPDATEVECMTELFRKQMKLCADACNNGFKYVESPLVRAIRNGWVCELQEPSLITRPAVMPGLNGLLDETGCVVLPTGEMLHRHPDCIIISTLNIDLEGCRPLNQAFMDRHHIIMDMQCPTDDVIVKRIKGMTGCGDDVPLKEMVQCIHQIATVCARHGATDGNVNSMRSLANWVQAGMLIGDYVQAAEWTVVSGATSDPETRTELSRTIANHSF